MTRRRSKKNREVVIMKLGESISDIESEANSTLNSNSTYVHIILNGICILPQSSCGPSGSIKTS